jgi:UDP-N-acetylglucosamine 4,6-dehydratase/UDP-glucose 4-epimerase
LISGKKILITGGTGSLGTALVKRLLKMKPDTIRIFSRDEWKQTQMQSEIYDKRLRFLLGDIRDKDRLNRALEDIDIVFHAAALKHVPVAEYNPFEFVRTNVDGTQNLIEACLNNKIQMAVGIGTDKAVSPVNTYGATKLLMERLFVAANFYKGNRKIKFICVRYGNVLGSRGSILPKFVEQIEKGVPVTITDPNMTRFNITMNEALDLIFRAMKQGRGGEIFVPKLKAYTVKDMSEAIFESLHKKPKIKIISSRPGERFHETLISKNEIRNTYESNQDYIVYNIEADNVSKNIKPRYSKTKMSEEYSSDTCKLLTKNEIKSIILKEGLIKP